MAIFDLTGPDFLRLYWQLFCGAMVLALLLPHLLRFPIALPMQRPQIDACEVAFLRGGKLAAFKAAIVSLWQRGLLTISRSRRLLDSTHAPNPTGLLPLEKYLLRKIGGSTAVDRVYKFPMPEEALSQSRLRAWGLSLSPLHRELLRLLRVLPPAVLLAIGVIKISVGISRGRPVVFLLLSSLVTAAAVIFWIMRPVRRTWRGDLLLRTLSRENSALRFTSRRRPEDLLPADAGMSVALFGVSATAFGYTIAQVLEPPREPSFHSWGLSSCGAGGCAGAGGGCGGGGGGGGGGCGGCGGGGH